jgi:hypothetical protein
MSGCGFPRWETTWGTRRANFQGFGGMHDGRLSRNMIFVPGIIIGNDSNANGAVHITQSKINT